MIELIILEYLQQNIDVPVFMEHPAGTDPERFIIIDKTGSGLVEKNVIKKATVVIQSYAASLLDACSLNEKVKDAMYGIAELSKVSRCSLNTDYNFTDTSTKRYRYQAVFELVHY